MTPAMIIGGIIAALALLVGLSYVIQTLDRNKNKRGKLEHALRRRARSLNALKQGFPKGFLTKELHLLVGRSILDTLQQLVAMDSNNDLYRKELAAATQELDKLRAHIPTQTRTHLGTEQDCKNAQKYLLYLGKIIENMLHRSAIKKEEAHFLVRQVTGLLTTSRVDAHLIVSRRAVAARKTRLGIHQLEMAINILKKDNREGQHGKEISELVQQIAVLEDLSRAMNENKIKQGAVEPALPNSKEWAEFEKQEVNWKKKSVYD